MSTYAELKAAVRGYLQRTVTVTDVLPGSATDVDSEINRMILQGANNAVRRAENLCDFGVNEVESLVTVPAGQSLHMVGLTDEISGEVFDMQKLLDAVWTYSESDRTLSTWPIALMTKKGFQRYKYNHGVVNRIVGVVRNNRLQFQPSLDEDVNLRLEGYRRFEVFNETSMKMIDFPLVDGFENPNGVYNVIGVIDGKPSFYNRVNGQLRGMVFWSSDDSKWFFQVPRNTDSGTPFLSYYCNTDPFPLVDADTYNIWYDTSDDAIQQFQFQFAGRENWLTQNAFEYLQWQTLVEVNHFLQIFVPRQEGTLPPPQALADRALEELIRNEEFNSSGLNNG